MEMPYLISLNLLLLKDIAYIGSWMHLVFVFVCVSLSLSFRNSWSCSLSSPDEIYGLYGLEYHTGSTVI